MKQENNNIIYTAEDIKRYITGGMSPEEMHAIEMAALDDPLLAEAMEGYELMEQKDWSKELAALQQEFNKNEKDETPVVAIGKSTAFKWWRAAAAVLVLGVAATTAYIFTNKSDNEIASPVAKVQSAVTDSVSIIAKADSVKPNINFVNADSNSQLTAKLDQVNTNGLVNYTITTPITVQGSTGFASTATAPQADSSSFIYKPSAGSEYLAMKDDKTGEVSSREKETATDMAVVTPSAKNNAVGNNNNATYSEGDFKNKAEESITTNNVNNGFDKYRRNSFNGLVVTPDNKPVSYANINIPQSKKPIQADANGKFYFTAADTSVKVTVTSAGYSSQKITLQNSTTQNTIVLLPQDIAVNSIGKKRKDEAKAPAKWHQTYQDSTDLDDEGEYVMPIGGWDEYNRYLSSKLQFPDVAKQKNVHGEVEVTVNLNDNGEISQAKVTKHLSPECDAEALRLVKEGPKWDMKKNREGTSKVTVKF